MSQIMRTVRIGIALCSLALMLTACGTSTENSKSVYNTTTESHAGDWKWAGHAAAAQADVRTCQACHGQDFSGGITATACNSCHLNSIAVMTGCTSCHAAPPSGSSVPNRAGAHAAHRILPNVTGVCATCHNGAGSGTENHDNGATEVSFLSSYNATSGTAVGNADGTCSRVSCHGGQTTPVWLSGTIDVNTQCLTCHAFGTAEYNSFNSGQHDFHVNAGGWNGDCWRCHDYTKLADVHFVSLNTTTLDGRAYTTLINDVNYDRNAGTCDVVCHPGARSW